MITAGTDACFASLVLEPVYLSALRNGKELANDYLLTPASGTKLTNQSAASGSGTLLTAQSAATSTGSLLSEATS